MSYPKYLSVKSLEKRYRDSGISESKIQFLKDLCLSGVDLYGAIHAEQLWDVYKELSEKTAVLKIQRKELYTALGIFRREELPYFVFEADEVYTEEPPTEKYRLLVSKRLVHSGYGKFTSLYRLIENALDKPYFVPANLLEYKDPVRDDRKEKLISWLSELSCTQTEFETSYGKTYPCAYTGKKLGEFSFISRNDDFELRYQRGEIEGHKGNAKYADELEAELVRFPVRSRRLMRTAVAAVAAVMLLGGSSVYVFAMPAEYVSLDAGESSVELALNRVGRVISVEPTKEDDRAMAETLSAAVRGKRVEDALLETMAAFREGGYLDGQDAVMIAGVTPASEKRGEELAEALENAATQHGDPIPLYTMGVTPAERSEAARKAGVPFVHAGYGFGSPDDFDLRISSIEELPAAAKQLLQN